MSEQVLRRDAETVTKEENLFRINILCKGHVLWRFFKKTTPIVFDCLKQVFFLNSGDSHKNLKKELDLVAKNCTKFISFIGVAEKRVVEICYDSSNQDANRLLIYLSKNYIICVPTMRKDVQFSKAVLLNKIIQIFSFTDDLQVMAFYSNMLEKDDRLIAMNKAIINVRTRLEYENKENKIGICK